MKINELIKTKEYNKLINLYNELKTKFIVENKALYDYGNEIIQYAKKKNAKLLKNIYIKNFDKNINLDVENYSSYSGKEKIVIKFSEYKYQAFLGWDVNYNINNKKEKVLRYINSHQRLTEILFYDDCVLVETLKGGLYDINTKNLFYIKLMIKKYKNTKLNHFFSVMIKLIYLCLGLKSNLIKDINRDILKGNCCFKIVLNNELNNYNTFNDYFNNKNKYPINFNKGNIEANILYSKTYLYIEENSRQLYFDYINKKYIKFRNRDLRKKKELCHEILLDMFYNQGLCQTDINVFSDTAFDCLENKILFPLKSKKKIYKLHNDFVNKITKNEKWSCKNYLGHKRVNEPFEKCVVYSKLIDNISNEFTHLNTFHKLFLEGEEQHNCVASYANKARDGKNIIFCFNFNDKHYTMEIVYDDYEYKIIQLYGKYNAIPDNEAVNFANNEISRINCIGIK